MSLQKCMRRLDEIARYIQAFRYVVAVPRRQKPEDHGGAERGFDEVVKCTVASESDDVAITARDGLRRDFAKIIRTFRRCEIY